MVGSLLHRLEWQSAFDGRFASLGLYLLVGVAILGCLFAIAYDGTSTRLATHPGAIRDRDFIMAWITDGYVHYGGLLRYPGGPPHPQPFFYRNDIGGWLQGIHVLQRVQYWVTGRYSFMLTAVHNQIVIMLSASFLGLLALRVARRTGVEPLRAACLGVACMLVYQTFPKNLMHFWQGSPHAAFVLFLAIFLVSEETSIAQGTLSRVGRLARAVAVFGMLYVEHVGGVLFLAVYFTAVLILRPHAGLDLRGTVALLLPALLALGLRAMQFVWVRHRFPSMEILGSTIGFRSGFDGAMTYYKTHFDLLYARRLSFAYPSFNNPDFNDWKWFFVAGVAALVILAWNYSRTPELKIPVWLVTIALGPYALQAFVFSQSVVIHSELYDILLALPLTLAVFGIVPAWSETRSGHTGLPVFLSLIVAFCYAMVQLRAYVAMIPPQ